MRLLTYNVYGLRRGLPGVAAVVRACEPDVVCVQEAPRLLFWRRRARALAAACGLTLVAGGRPAAANLLLARPGLPVLRTATVKLPWHPPRHRRGVVLAVVATDAGPVGVAGTHLSLYADERAAHLPRLLAAVDALGVPTVLVGDLNEEPGGAVRAALGERFAAADPGPTYPAEAPRRRIDAVYADPALAVECRVVDLPGAAGASDHRPVLAEIRGV